MLLVTNEAVLMELNLPLILINNRNNTSGIQIKPYKFEIMFVGYQINCLYPVYKDLHQIIHGESIRPNR